MRLAVSNFISATLTGKYSIDTEQQRKRTPRPSTVVRESRSTHPGALPDAPVAHSLARHARSLGRPTRPYYPKLIQLKHIHYYG